MLQYSPDSSKLVHRVSVDLKKRTVGEKIHLVQYDNRLPIIAVSLFSDYVPYNIPANAEGNIRVKKKDGTFVYNPALGCNDDRTILYFEITNQISTFPGVLQPVIEIKIGEMVAASGTIEIIIDRNPIQYDDVESTNEYKTIESYAENTKQNAQAAKKSETNAKASETASKNSETAARNSEVNAKASETAAKKSETNAKASETAAKKSETNAKASETASKNSETAARSSEVNAKASETASKNSETEAKAAAVTNSQDISKIINGTTRVGKSASADSVEWNCILNKPKATISIDGLMSLTDKQKLDGIQSGAQVNAITGVKGGAESTYRTGNVNISKSNVGLSNVDNTADNQKYLHGAKQLTSEDLNGVGEYGYYYATGANTVKNLPDIGSEKGFGLHVMRAAGGDIRQELVCGTTHYVRALCPSINYVSAWEKVVTALDGAVNVKGLVANESLETSGTLSVVGASTFRNQLSFETGSGWIGAYIDPKASEHELTYKTFAHGLHIWGQGRTDTLIRKMYLIAPESAAVERTFQFPNKDGTIAVTSDLAAYLPLSGGNINGNLSVGGYISLSVDQNTNSLVRTAIITGQDGSNGTRQYAKAHSIELGVPNAGNLKFNEYTGTFQFYQTDKVFQSSGNGDLLVEVNPSGLVVNTQSIAGKTFCEGLRINSSADCWAGISLGAARGTTTNGDNTRGWSIARPGNKTCLVLAAHGNQENDNQMVRIERDGSLYEKGQRVYSPNNPPPDLGLNSSDYTYSLNGEGSVVASTAGFIRYNNGLQICWGYKNCSYYDWSDDSAPQEFLRGNVTFSKAFVDNKYTLMLTPRFTSYTGRMYEPNQSSTSFYFNTQTGTPLEFSWVALGKWR